MEQGSSKTQKKTSTQPNLSISETHIEEIEKLLIAEIIESLGQYSDNIDVDIQSAVEDVVADSDIANHRFRKHHGVLWAAIARSCIEAKVHDEDTPEWSLQDVIDTITEMQRLDSIRSDKTKEFPDDYYNKALISIPTSITKPPPNDNPIHRIDHYRKRLIETIDTRRIRTALGKIHSIVSDKHAPSGSYVQARKALETFMEDEKSRKKARAARPQTHPSLADIRDALDENERGDARLLARIAEGRYLYNHSIKSEGNKKGTWYIYKGPHWEQDDAESILYEPFLTLCKWYRKAGDSFRAFDKSLYNKLIGRAEKLSSASRINNVERLARVEPSVSTTESDWQCEKWYFGVQNGIVDLQKGVLKKAKPEYKIRHVSEGEYNKSMGCPKWIEFLNKIFDEDDELIDYIQKSIGYSMVGTAEEETVYILHGSGSNGKSEFLKVLRMIGGSYAAWTPFATFELAAASANNRAPRDDLARLHDRRIVISGENKPRSALDEGLIKAMTGDNITARQLYKQLFEYKPQFTVWFAVNHIPRIIGGGAKGLWRRLARIPFLVEIKQEERISEYAENVLRPELPGIIAWAVKGCLRWQEEGLMKPSVIVEATEEYHSDVDILGGFIDACCELGEGYKAGTADLHKIYLAWMEREGEKPIASRRGFTRALTDRGIPTAPRRSGGADSYKLGIRIKSEKVYELDLPLEGI